MGIGITELIQKIGDDNVRLQPLDSCLTDMRSKKGENLYTFASEVPFDLKGPNKLGLVLWLDRDDVKKILGQ
jgi:hypothetical protein